MHAKAKGEPSYRFYGLYDKIHRKDVLLHGWNCCRANGGGAGVDGQSFEQIEAWGLEGWLGELAEEIAEDRHPSLGPTWAARSHGDLLPSERWSFASPFSFTSVPLCLPENSLEFAQERDSIDLGVTIGEGPKNRGEGIEHRLPSPDRFAHGARIFVASS